MSATKVILCWFIAISISEVFTAPPRNVIQMEEKVGSQQNLEVKPAERQMIPPVDGHKDMAKLNLNIPDQNKLSVEDLRPADHLDAVKLEQDGMINKDYKKEIFLGNHEEIEDESLDVAESKLKEIFTKVDKDNDGKLCAGEIQNWIVEKTQEHFDEAVKENDHIFKHMDPDGDGFVDWREYYEHFLLAKGYPLERAKKHVVDYDDIDLDYEVRDQIARYRFRWMDSETGELDNKLTKSEFFAFRHPEQSELNMKNMADSIMESLDRDDDKVLTEDEFVALPLGDMDDEEQRNMDKQWQRERSEEFRNQIDYDHNGKVTIEELKRYIDPRNPDNAKSDTKTLLEEIDENNDQCMSWNEIDNHKEMFVQSKVVNIRRILHDEF